MRTGYSKVDITPRKLGIMGGYGNLRKAKDIHDKIYARVLVVEKNIYVSIDWVAVDKELINRIEKKLQGYKCYIFATHTHSGPGGTINHCMFEDTNIDVFGQTDSIYLDWVSEKISKEIKRISKDLIMSTIYYFDGSIKNRYGSRHEKEDTSLQKYSAYEVRQDSGAKILILIMGCHPTVLGWKNCLISNDYVGYLIKKLESKYDNIIFIQSASADISTRYWRKKSDFRSAQELGINIAKDILNKSFEPKKLEFDARNNIFKEQEYSLYDKRGRWVTFNYYLVRVGQHKYVLVPFEVYTSLGKDIKETTDYEVITMCNGYLSYLVDDDGFTSNHYESEVSLFNRAQTTEIVNNILSSLIETEKII